MKTRRIPLAAKALSLFLLVLALLPWAGMVEADDAPVWLMGGGASPMSAHSTIRMDSEEVTIRLHKDSYTVDAIFLFFNTGDTTTEWVGFPKRGRGRSEMFTGTSDFIRFETWVGDRQVQFQEKQDMFSRAITFLNRKFSNFVEDQRWLVKEVTFPGNSAAMTRVKYEAPYDVRDAKCAFYIYGTGSYWKGNIGKASFTVDASEIGGTGKIGLNLPESSRRQISENTVCYELRDFEPPPGATLKVVFPVR